MKNELLAGVILYGPASSVHLQKKNYEFNTTWIFEGIFSFLFKQYNLNYEQNGIILTFIWVTGELNKVICILFCPKGLIQQQNQTKSLFPLHKEFFWIEWSKFKELIFCLYLLVWELISKDQGESEKYNAMFTNWYSIKYIPAGQYLFLTHLFRHYYNAAITFHSCC